MANLDAVGKLPLKVITEFLSEDHNPSPLLDIEIW
jgi:hypothetical protein